VTFTGRVSSDEYRSWLRRAAVALQLRHETNGESSAAIMDALAAGVPVVTNLPAAAELPAGTVAMVPWDVSAGPLADVVGALLQDDGGLGDRGRAYAASWTFDDVASALLDVVRALPATSPALL
jgi:glycosyltransferase involved in cell wall biosynthesis